MEFADGDVDRLAEATDGRYHWGDPGMDDFERGWEEFGVGLRVEVRTSGEDGDVWRPGTIVEGVIENERGIIVECDERFHGNLDFYEGRGASVMVYMNTRRGIWSNLRTLSEKAEQEPAQPS